MLRVHAGPTILSHLLTFTLRFCLQNQHTQNSSRVTYVCQNCSQLARHQLQSQQSKLVAETAAEIQVVAKTTMLCQKANYSSGEDGSRHTSNCSACGGNGARNFRQLQQIATTPRGCTNDHNNGPVDGSSSCESGSWI